MSSRCTQTSTCLKRSCSTPSRSVILGIDPGTTGMGYAFLVAAPERALLIECGIVDVRASATAGERLLPISEALDELIARHRPFARAVVRLYFTKNVRTATRTAEAGGIVHRE